MGGEGATEAEVRVAAGGADGAVHGATAWGSNRTIADLLGPPTALHGFAPVWGPTFWNLAEHPVDELLAGGPWMQILSVMRVQDAELVVLEFTEALRKVNTIQEDERVRWDALLGMILTYIVWRP